jgi:sRNA-binding carbon storage regulator CsrA
MVILKRYKTESVTFTLPDGQTIRVRVEQVGGGQARLSCQAPREIVISRTECRPGKVNHGHEGTGSESTARDAVCGSRGCGSCEGPCNRAAEGNG